MPTRHLPSHAPDARQRRAWRHCGTFDAVGIYPTDGLPLGSLVVSGAPDDAHGVPEPASWAILIAGSGAAGFVTRRRQFVQRRLARQAGRCPPLRVPTSGPEQ